MTVEQGAPVLVIPSARGLAGGRVLTRAGPWRSSGGWWAPGPEGAWDRDEWDLEFDDGVYRVVRHRPTGHWQVEGVFD